MTDTEQELQPRKIQRYGWKRSLPDQRDILADTSALPVLPEVDPRGEYMTEPYDQGNLGSCTANAVAAAVDAHLLAEGKDAFHPARLGIYALERLYEGSPLTQDTGAYGRDGFKACRRFGMIPESELPYSTEESAWSVDPREQIRASAERTKLDQTYKVVHRSQLSMQRVLSNRQTIAFGFTVYESFESQEVARTGVVPMPGPNERCLGGHEVLAVGYLKDHPQHVLVRNSWGSEWGDGGYFLLPWAYLLDPSLSDDFRTIYRPAA